MSPGKRFKMEPKVGHLDAETSWSDSDDDETGRLAEQRSYIRTMVSRATVVYLGLFMGLAFIMSIFGVNPMTNNGLMPKILLVFVGLALMIALANIVTDLSREQGRNWLRLMRQCTTSAKKPDE